MNPKDTRSPALPLFDSHLHIIPDGYPLKPNQGFTPAYFSHLDYLESCRSYHMIGGAVVSGSFQGFDQTYLLASLEKLGPSFVGVTQLPQSVSEEELVFLDSQGVRAVRFNVKRGGSESIKHLENLAQKIHQTVGWHVELYIDAQGINDLFDRLVRLPSICIDHLGLNHTGLPSLVKLVEKGARVKACGFGRVDFAIGPAIKTLFNANPHALMFGTDLPSTRAPRPYRHSDYVQVIETLGAIDANFVFYENALDFYRLNNPIQRPEQK